MHEYVVILDKERDHCRLFRADSPDMPLGAPLWHGNGLRRGYDQMIRLNRERRPVKSYCICARDGGRSGKAYRVFSAAPEAGGWEVVEVAYAWSEARAAMAALVKARDEERAAKDARVRAIMKRVGLEGRRRPRFTEKDLQYIDWLERTGRLAA